MQRYDFFELKCFFCKIIVFPKDKFLSNKNLILQGHIQLVQFLHKSRNKKYQLAEKQPISIKSSELLSKI